MWTEWTYSLYRESPKKKKQQELTDFREPKMHSFTVGNWNMPFVIVRVCVFFYSSNFQKRWQQHFVKEWLWSLFSFHLHCLIIPAPDLKSSPVLIVGSEMLHHKFSVLVLQIPGLTNCFFFAFVLPGFTDFGFSRSTTYCHISVFAGPNCIPAWKAVPLTKYNFHWCTVRFLGFMLALMR